MNSRLRAGLRCAGFHGRVDAVLIADAVDHTDWSYWQVHHQDPTDESVVTRMRVLLSRSDTLTWATVWAWSPHGWQDVLTVATGDPEHAAKVAHLVIAGPTMFPPS